MRANQLFCSITGSDPKASNIPVICGTGRCTRVPIFSAGKPGNVPQVIVNFLIAWIITSVFITLKKTAKLHTLNNHVSWAVSRKKKLCRGFYTLDFWSLISLDIRANIEQSCVELGKNYTFESRLDALVWQDWLVTEVGMKLICLPQTLLLKKQYKVMTAPRNLRNSIDFLNFIFQMLFL